MRSRSVARATGQPAGVKSRSGERKEGSTMSEETKEATQNPFNSRERKLGLALSGGGFRAALFHIGVLGRLAELDLLKSVSVLSTVSGGSIIGAAYYLMVKELLEGRRSDGLKPSRAAYIRIIKELEDKFLEGVQKNIRTLTFADPKKNFKMLHEDYSRSDHIAELYREHFYKRIWDRIRAKPSLGEPELSDEIFLRDIKIVPCDDLLRDLAPDLAGKTFEDRLKEFRVKSYNERADHKVPILTINATTLNTCHNWQFTSSWVGEPPSADQDSDFPKTDYNRRLERLRFDGQAQEKDGKTPTPTQMKKLLTLTLGDAVAASAAVPGIFHPFAIHDLYTTSTGEEIVVQLVDGGVFDNQGLAALFDEQYTHIICSDASGQTEDSRNPSPRFYSVVMRSNDILMDRVREQELEALFLSDEGYEYITHCGPEGQQGRCKELRERLLRHLNVKEYAFFHLKDSFRGSAAFPSFPAHKPDHPRGKNPTYYNGFYYLSNIRTDLDSFTDIEAFSLMYDGYCLSGNEIARRAQLSYSAPTPQDREATRSGDWTFLAIREVIRSDPEKVLKHLQVGSHKLFKVWKLLPWLKGVGIGAGVLLGALVLWQLSRGVADEETLLPDVEEMLLRIDALGRRLGRWPLGENWPFSAREFDWERGEDLDGARRDLAHLLAKIESGRGGEILVDPRTGKPFSDG